jgi:two-component system response regulator DegU
MTTKIRIAIAEDHELVRKGYVSLLKDEPSLNIIGDFENGKELLNFLKHNSVDVILMDIEMPICNGIEALKLIQDKYPTIKTIMLSMHYSGDYITNCLALGAKGFLPKNCDIEHLVTAIKKVHTNGFYLDDTTSKLLLDNVNQGSNPPNDEVVELTIREIEVLVLICEGLLTKEIASRLNISVRTIEVHRKNISEKLNVNNVAGLIKYAVQNGIYSYN